MADLVPQDRSQLGFRADVGEQPARHIDESAGKGERIDRGIVHDAERPRELRPLPAGGESRAEALYVPLPGGVRIETDRTYDLLVVLPSHFDLLGLADQHQLILAG